MFIINHKNLFFGISGALVLLSIIAIAVFGLPLGIDFKGGTLIEIEYVNERPTVSLLQDGIGNLPLSFGNVQIQPTDERGYLIRTNAMGADEHKELLQYLRTTGGLEEKRFTTIGPVIGEELQQKAYIAVSLVVVVIVVFIAFVFRTISVPVKSWKYGIVAIVALMHDILIPTGLMAILGAYTNAEIDTLFVTALLAILGLSVNDTIVVFDRIRENILLKVSKDFSETVGISLKETITRSINTSITTLFVLLALYFFGPESTKYFALILSVGLIAGTYSSIFLASPLLVVLAKKKKD